MTTSRGWDRSPEHGIRKLIEVALPLEAVNEAARREKAVPRKGLPATMHLWWSRKPIGAARAILFASLVDDPGDRPDLWPAPIDREQRRAALVELVADLARWDCPAHRLADAVTILDEQFGGAPPVVVDPFCGGGTIPYAAATLNLPTRGFDLNPVAVITAKAITEVPRRIAGHGPVHPDVDPSLSGSAAIGADVAAYGADLIAEVALRIGHVYPTITALDGSPTRAVSYLWARTTRCRNGTCGAEIPLLSTWWLSRKKSNPWHVRPIRDPTGSSSLEFEVVRGVKPDDLEDLKVATGANYRCPFCGEVADADAIREEGRERRLGLRLVAIQTFADPARPRSGRAWTNATAAAQSSALDAWPAGMSFPLTDHAIPEGCGNITSFGITTFEELLTPRQRLLMTTACDVLTELRSTMCHDALSAGVVDDRTPLHLGGTGTVAHADAITTYLGITISRMANRVSTMTVHNRANGSVEQSFIQPGYAFYGDFPEADPFSGSTGSWGNALDHVSRAVTALPVGTDARILRADAVDGLQQTRDDAARRSPDCSDGQDSRRRPARVSGVIVSTDPPYYDMFDYGALSELFYPWLRLTLGDVWPHDTSSPRPPRAEQIIANTRYFDGDHTAAHRHFEVGLSRVMTAIGDVQSVDVPITIYYGYQRTQQHSDGRSSMAWEALLDALRGARMSVVRTWPLRTERPEGVKSNTRAMASSILFVCRRRPPSLPTASLGEFEADLGRRIPAELARLVAMGIPTVDLTPALVGAGLEVFTSFDAIDGSDGSPLSTRSVLQTIYRAIDDVITHDVAASTEETRRRDPPPGINRRTPGLT